MQEQMPDQTPGTRGMTLPPLSILPYLPRSLQILGSWKVCALGTRIQRKPRRSMSEPSIISLLPPFQSTLPSPLQALVGFRRRSCCREGGQRRGEEVESENRATSFSGPEPRSEEVHCKHIRAAQRFSPSLSLPIISGLQADLRPPTDSGTYCPF